MTEDPEVVGMLTLTELSRSCGVEGRWIVELVEQGILEPGGGSRSEWRFASVSLTTVSRVQRLQRDLGVNLPGAAAILTLTEETARLRRRLRMLEAFERGE